jgi:hypothetical protein
MVKKENINIKSSERNKNKEKITLKKIFMERL